MISRLSSSTEKKAVYNWNMGDELKCDLPITFFLK